MGNPAANTLDKVSGELFFPHTIVGGDPNVTFDGFSRAKLAMWARSRDESRITAGRKSLSVPTPLALGMLGAAAIFTVALLSFTYLYLRKTKLIEELERQRFGDESPLKSSDLE